MRKSCKGELEFKFKDFCMGMTKDFEIRVIIYIWITIILPQYYEFTLRWWAYCTGEIKIIQNLPNKEVILDIESIAEFMKMD